MLALALPMSRFCPFARPRLNGDFLLREVWVTAIGFPARIYPLPNPRLARFSAIGFPLSPLVTLAGERWNAGRFAWIPGLRFSERVINPALSVSPNLRP